MGSIFRSVSIYKPLLLLAALAPAISTASPAIALDDAFMVDVVRSGSYDKVSVSATLKGAFTPQIRESVSSGAPVIFTYFIQLKQWRPFIWNETVKELVIKKMVKYDTLKKQYMVWEKKGEDEDDISFEIELASVNYDEEKKKNARKKEKRIRKHTTEPVMEPIFIEDSVAFEKWMTHIDNVTISDAKDLKALSRYYVRARCKMKSVRLIPPFNYILFFVSLWDFDTDWTNSTTFTINSNGTENKKPPN